MQVQNFSPLLNTCCLCSLCFSYLTDVPLLPLSLHTVASHVNVLKTAETFHVNSIVIKVALHLDLCQLHDNPLGI